MDTPKQMLDTIVKMLQEAHESKREYAFLVAIKDFPITPINTGTGCIMGGNSTDPELMAAMDETFHRALQHTHEMNKQNIIDGAKKNGRKNK